MRKLLLSLLLFLGLLSFVYAQPNSVASEVQAFLEARQQTEKAAWSQLILAMSMVVITVVTGCLLANLRSLAFLFLTFYGVLMINVPFYVPTAFQGIFGIVIIVLGIVGLLYRLLALTTGPKKPTAAPIEPPKAS